MKIRAIIETQKRVDTEVESIKSFLDEIIDNNENVTKIKMSRNVLPMLDSEMGLGNVYRGVMLEFFFSINLSGNDNDADAYNGLDTKE